MTDSPLILPMPSPSTHSSSARRNITTTQSDIEVIKTYGYKLKLKLGEGSYAKVYFAEPTAKNESPIAIKVVDTEIAHHSYVAKFLPRELKIISRLDHPHVIFVQMILKRRHRYFLFMRWAEKGDLLDYIHDHGPVKEMESQKWCCQTILALQYLHSLDVAHRDLKCENILITIHNNIKLCDFGFSRLTCDSNGKQMKSDTFCGSYPYAPPEIINEKLYNPKPGDIWSAGVVLFIMLNRRSPFPGKTFKDILRMQNEKKWKMSPNLSFSDHVLDLLRKMLEPNVRLRYTAENVLDHPWFQTTPVCFEYINNVQQLTAPGLNELKLQMRLQFQKGNEPILKNPVDGPLLAHTATDYKSKNEFLTIDQEADIVEVTKEPLPSTSVKDPSIVTENSRDQKIKKSVTEQSRAPQTDIVEVTREPLPSSSGKGPSIVTKKSRDQKTKKSVNKSKKSKGSQK